MDAEKLNKIEIRSLNIEDSQELSQALTMMNRIQGVGLFKMNYLMSKLDSDDAIALGGFINGELLTVGCAEIINEFSYYLPFDPSINLKLESHKVGSLCTLCVREDLQGKGIGQQMSRARIKWLGEEKCSVVLGVSWVSGLKHTSDRVFQKLGFVKIKEVKDFFKSGSEKFPFECPGCKTQPCTCSATLHQLNISTSL